MLLAVFSSPCLSQLRLARYPHLYLSATDDALSQLEEARTGLDPVMILSGMNLLTTRVAHAITILNTINIIVYLTIREVT